MIGVGGGRRRYKSIDSTLYNTLMSLIIAIASNIQYIIVYNEHNINIFTRGLTVLSTNNT